MKTGQSVGIWGLGKVGKAYLQLLTERGYKQLSVLDKRELTDDEKEWLTSLAITFYQEPQSRDLFLENNDYILPSPGVDIRPYYTHYYNKFLNELDLFYTWWPYPIIGITGSVGKTSVTHLIGECLRYHDKKIAVGGNIGTATAELLLSADQYPDGAVLEVSSFQLEHTHLFAPQLAIWTTFVPNHLDRHETEHEYFMAKYQLLAHQKAHDSALVPLSVAQYIRKTTGNQRPLHIVTSKVDDAVNFPLQSDDTLWVIHNNAVIRQNHNAEPEIILDLATIPPLTFVDNIIMVTAALSLCGLAPDQIRTALSYCSLPAHRLEFLGTHHGIQFYNDSKATTPASTLAAVTQLKNAPIILLLGGLSKGVDRKPMIRALLNQVKHIVCFGADRDQLLSWCTEVAIPATSTATMDEAFAQATRHATEGDSILLSPSGSSYDLFTDYQARGDYFKSLVETYTGPVK